MGDRRRAILYLIGAKFCLATMSAFVRLTGDLPTMQKLLLRSLIMVAVSYTELRRSGFRLKLERSYALPIILRGLFGAISVMCNFYAIDHMNLADANMLNKLSPFITVFFAWLFLKEAFRPRDIAALILAFLGTLLIIKPGGGDIAALPGAVALLGGVTAGLAFTAVRASNKAGAPKPLIVFSFSFSSCLISFPSTVLHFAPMTGKQWLCILACGLCGVAGHFLNTRAYALAPPRDISVYDYSQVVFSALLGFLLFGQIPDGLSVLGYAVIIGTGIFVFLQNRKEAA